MLIQITVNNILIHALKLNTYINVANFVDVPIAAF